MQQQKHPEHAHIFIVGTMAHFQKGPTDYLSFYKTALYDLAVELTSLKPIHWSRQLRCNKLIICAARKFAGLVQTSVALSVDPVWFNSEEARTERTYLSFVLMGDESV